jgi:N-acetylmuramoyl-L-alanine amidase
MMKEDKSLKKIMILLLTIVLITIQFLDIDQSHNDDQPKSYAQTLDHIKVYEAKKGDSLFNIAVRFGISEVELKQANFKKTDHLEPGEKLIIPEKKITDHEQDLLARLVHAEAKGEPYAGKVAVALVVLNRVKSEKFPDTIKEVIYEERQFEPVENGSIHEPAGEESKKAVKEAIALEGQDDGSLFFFNPDKTNSKWLRTRTVTAVIGNHRFAK